MQEFPIPTADGTYGKEIGQFVDKILARKGHDPAADVAALEREIDARMYRLYGLTADEIKIIEKATE